MTADERGGGIDSTRRTEGVIESEASAMKEAEEARKEAYALTSALCNWLVITTSYTHTIYNIYYKYLITTIYVHYICIH